MQYLFSWQVYWCQVINTTANPDQSLMSSNVITLLAPENYFRMKCSGDLQLQVMPNRSYLSDQPSTSGLIANSGAHLAIINVRSLMEWRIIINMLYLSYL